MAGSKATTGSATKTSENLAADGPPTSSLSLSQNSITAATMNTTAGNNSKAVLAASQGMKVRSIHSRISQAKINNSITAGVASSSTSTAQGDNAGGNLGRCQSMNDRISGALLSQQ